MELRRGAFFSYGVLNYNIARLESTKNTNKLTKCKKNVHFFLTKKPSIHIQCIQTCYINQNKNIYNSRKFFPFAFFYLASLHLQKDFI